MKPDLKKYNLNKIGQKFFLLGTFFLASALPISGGFYLLAIVLSFINNQENPLNDLWNYPLFISIGLIIFSTLNNTIFNVPIETSQLDNVSVILGIFNWIPLFISFWAFQPYLKHKPQRESFAKYLLAGAIPVLISCISQYWFKVYGPFETLNGLIVWFQKPLSGNSGVSGLFSNQNYAGFWLSIIWPFSIFVFRNIHKKRSLKIIFFINAFIIFYLSILTNSRNSLISIIISVSLLFKIKFFIIFIIALCLFLGIYFSLVNLSIIKEFSPNSFIPVDLIEQIFTTKIKKLTVSPRFEIWLNAIKLIIGRPFWGWGASTFAVIYTLKGGSYKIQHTHNIPLELAYNFGMPLAFILTVFSIYLLFKGWKISLSKGRNYLDLNLYWLTSLTLVFISHINDISYYDGKISLLIWILLAGVKCMNDEERFKNRTC